MVSIILTAKGKLKELTIPCIRSIRGTVKVPHEIIGLDDGSKDDTYAFMRRSCDKAIRLKGIGVGAARNVGLRNATGDHILFADNDIFPEHAGWLGAMLEDSQKHNVGMIGPFLSCEPDRWELSRSGDGLIDMAHVSGACMLFPRSTFGRLGMLDPVFSRRGEDTDYCFRAKLSGLRVVITPRVFVVHRGGATYNGNQETEQLRKFWHKYRNHRHLLNNFR
jgi:GT2 family glycosyltransferase